MRSQKKVKGDEGEQVERGVDEFKAGNVQREASGR